MSNKRSAKVKGSKPDTRALKIAAITDKAAPENEAPLWKDHLAALSLAVEARHPDAVERLKTEVGKLDGEISALVNRRELVAQTLESEQQQREATCAAELSDFLARHGKDEQALIARRERLPQVTAGREKALGAEIKRLHARMKQLARLLREAEKPKGTPKGDGPTAEAGLKPATRDIIGVLEARLDGGITHHQAEAARKIAEINEAISAAGQLRATNMAGTGGGRGGPFRDIAIAGKLDETRSRKYLPWCQSMQATAASRRAFDIVIKVSVMNVSVEALARHHHVHRQKVIADLKDGLDAYINQPWVKADGKALSVADMDS